MKRWRSLAVATLVAAITAACAGKTGTPTAARTSSATGRTVTVTAAESGKSVTLHVGDLLVLALPSFGERPGLLRTALAYPRDLLLLIPSSRQASAYWRFSAKARGTGMIRVTSLPCGPILGPATASGEPCPLTGATGEASSAPAGAGMPARLFTLVVTVS